MPQYERIKKLRLELGWSQEKIAEYLKMSQTGYSKYEIGARDIPTDILIQLAKLYSTSIDYLLGATDSKEEPPRNK